MEFLGKHGPVHVPALTNQMQNFNLFGDNFWESIRDQLWWHCILTNLLMRRIVVFMANSGHKLVLG